MNSRVVKVSLVPKSRSLRRLLALVLVSVSISAHAGQAEDRALLKARLEGLLSQPPLAGSHVSGEVVSLEDGAQLWSRTPNDELNPASNTKVVTAAVALLKLGPEYRFTTELLADGGVGKNGRIKALYLRGKADPTLDTERLQSFASDLWHRGVRQVQDLVLDDSFLDDQPWGPGWDTEDSDKPYAAPVGALSVNHNSVGIWVVPGDRPGKARIELDPEAKGFFVLDNRVQTVRAGNRKHLVPHTMDGGNDRTRVVVAGRVAVGDPQVFWRRVTDPAFYTGYVLKQALIERGIKVTGKVKRGVTPASATSITIFESHALGEIVREMNKVSSNFQAEMILKTLGAEVKGAPGTWAKGVEAAEGILADLGLAKGTYTLKNGSGLNDTNRFSAHQITTLLAAMWKKFHVSAEFVASLSVAGRDGTLRQRMEGTDAAGRLRAKTGTLDKVTALSGYLQSVGGERMVFSLLVNDWAGRSGPVVTAVDRFGALMASTGAVDPLLAQADLPPPELKARLASYAAMAASPDPKNAPILRAEIAIVKDPLLKAAAADALYRTAPGEGGGAALLDVLPPGPELYVRLRAMGRELLLPLPLVSTLLDLGADGSADALARLLALAPLALGPNAEPELAQALSEGLADVSDAAPEEMKAALLAAPELQSKAAITLIAQGLAVANFDTARSALGQALSQSLSVPGLEGENAQRLFDLLTLKESPADLDVSGASAAANTAGAGSVPAPVVAAASSTAQASAAQASPAAQASLTAQASPAAQASLAGVAASSSPAPVAAAGSSTGAATAQAPVAAPVSPAPAPPAHEGLPHDDYATPPFVHDPGLDPNATPSAPPQGAVPPTSTAPGGPAATAVSTATAATADASDSHAKKRRGKRRAKKVQASTDDAAAAAESKVGGG